MSDSAWTAYRERVLLALDHAAELPSELFLPVFGLPVPARGASGGPGISHGDLEVTPALSNALALDLDATGGLQGVHVAASSSSGAADTTILAMVQQAAASHAFPPLPGGTTGTDSIRLYVVVESMEPVPGTRAAVLGQLAVPVWPLAHPAQLASGAQPADPQHVAHGAPRADSVRVMFVVDAGGAVVGGTARLEVPALSAGRPTVGSEDRVLQSLPQLTFDPALIGTCRVPELVVQSFALPNADSGTH